MQTFGHYFSYVSHLALLNVANDVFPFHLDNGVNLTAPIVDFCAQCPQFNVGLSAVAFQKFAPLSDGIVPNVTWEIV